MKLALGTVQFGLPYGVSNQGGQTQPDEVAAILARAARGGIDTLDTARAYGESEAVLGRLLPSLPPFRLISKVPPIGGEAGKVRASVRESLEILGVDRLEAVMFHRSSDLLSDNGAACWRELEALKAEGRIGKIGLSAYGRHELDEAVRRFPIEIVQVPANVLDQRLLLDGTLSGLKSRGIEVHVRSALLQGLLVMEKDKIPAFFDPIRTGLLAWSEACARAGVSNLAGCLGFLNACEEIDRVVVGVNNRAQLDEVIAAASVQLPFDCREFAIDEERFLNPSCWKV